MRVPGNPEAQVVSVGNRLDVGTSRACARGCTKQSTPARVT